MKRKFLMVGTILALIFSGTFVYGNTENIKWLDVDKAEFLEENSDFIIYTAGDQREGVLDLQGRDMIKYGEYNIVEESEGFFRTSGNNLFYDEENNISNPKTYNLFYKGSSIFNTDEYEYLSVVKEGMIFAQKNGKLGFLKSDGSVAIGFKYDYAENFNHGVAVVGEIKGENILYGVIDKTGKFLIPLKYNYVSKMSEGYYLFAKDIDGVLKYGLVDQSGQEKISAKYDGMLLLEGNNLVVMLKEGDKKKFGIVDLNDQPVTSIENDFVGSLSEGTYLIGKNKKFGYIDATGKEIVKQIYDAAINFHEGLAAVQNSGKWGFIDKKGTQVVACEFDRVSDFKNGHAVVKLNEKYGIIDKKGNFEVELIYDNIVGKKDGNYVLILGNRYALIDKTLKPILSDYEYINSSNNNYLIKKAGKFGIVWNAAPSAANTAIGLSKFNMQIDGANVQNNAYLIDDSNYIRLRDMAFLMKNTQSKFSVKYTDELQRIDLEKKKDYQGQSLTAIKEFSAGDVLGKSTAELYVDGKIYNLDSYNVNGNNYYKLRDLGTVLGFSVDWNQTNKMVVIKTK